MWYDITTFRPDEQIDVRERKFNAQENRKREKKRKIERESEWRKPFDWNEKMKNAKDSIAS